MGINKQAIFEEEEDYARFAETLTKYKEISGYKLFAYCLMGNHLHLLLKVEKEDLDVIVKRIAGSYVYWFNLKYARSGHLFQDRFKSEAVEGDSYFMTALRYIHHNPVKAGLCKKLEAYKFSSYKDYLKGKSGLVDVDFVFSMISRAEFERYNQQECDYKGPDVTKPRIRLKDADAKAIIAEISR